MFFPNTGAGAPNSAFWGLPATGPLFFLAYFRTFGGRTQKIRIFGVFPFFTFLSTREFLVLSPPFVLSPPCFRPIFQASKNWSYPPPSSFLGAAGAATEKVVAPQAPPRKKWWLRRRHEEKMKQMRRRRCPKRKTCAFVYNLI